MDIVELPSSIIEAHAVTDARSNKIRCSHEHYTKIPNGNIKVTDELLFATTDAQVDACNNMEEDDDAYSLLVRLCGSINI